jgi:hypothetical protein
MEKTGGWGGVERDPSKILPAPILEISWIFCGNSGNLIGIFVNIPSSDRKSFQPAWADQGIPYGAWKKSSGLNKDIFQALQCMHELSSVTKIHRGNCFDQGNGIRDP